MKLTAIALDYDGTIATDGVLDPAVRDAIAAARQHGLAVALVTGRQLDDLRQAAGDLTCFDVVVGENGAVLHFPASGRHQVIGHRPSEALLNELRRRGVPFSVGEVVVATDAAFAAQALAAVRRLEQPLILAFNRSSLMLLPQSVSKATGLRQALFALRLSVHNTIGIGDAENDHELLDACEVGAAVGWGSAALRAAADEIIEGDGPPAVAEYIRRVLKQPRLSPAQMGRRRLVLGRQFDGEPVRLAVRGRTILIAGEPGTGKSWLAGLLCEQLILQGYCMCIIDPEGDYRSLEALPGIVALGGEDLPPSPRAINRALRHPDLSVLIDLSQLSHRRKLEYLHGLLPMLVAHRRHTGLPHKILLDEAHYYLGGPDAERLIDPELAGYILVSYRLSALSPPIRTASDAVVLVTRETDPAEVSALQQLIAARSGERVEASLFRELAINEAALLPAADSRHGPIRFQLGPRLTAHVRHRAKYLEMPVLDEQAFVFTDDGRRGPSASTLKQFMGLLAAVPPRLVEGHLRRHDFSRWLADVFRDAPLAAHVRAIEERVSVDQPRDLAADIVQSIRARYETAVDEP